MRKLCVNLWLIAIVLLGGWLRCRDLDVPATYMFDEVYHIPTINLIARGHPWAWEWWHLELTDFETQPGCYIDWLHPPLAKLIQAASVKMVGANPWGWRLPSALAGTVLIVVVFYLTQTLMTDSLTSKNKKNTDSWLPALAGLIAAALTAVDGLAIAQSRLAMNDIFVTLFMAIAILSYWRGRRSGDRRHYLLVGLWTGLAVASKWSGIYLLLFYGLWELITGKWSTWRAAGKTLVHTSLFCLTIISVSAVVYITAYLPLFRTHHWSWSHFAELHRQIWLYQTGLDATHPYSSRAWEWPLGLKPVYIYVNDDGSGQIWNRPWYPSWYLTLTCLPIALGAIIVRPRSVTPKTHLALGFLALAYGSFWLPWLFSPRIMFFHHYLPALPSLWSLAGIILAMIVQRIFHAFKSV